MLAHERDRLSLEPAADLDFAVHPFQLGVILPGKLLEGSRGAEIDTLIGIKLTSGGSSPVNASTIQAAARILFLMVPGAPIHAVRHGKRDEGRGGCTRQRNRARGPGQDLRARHRHQCAQNIQ